MLNYLRITVTALSLMACLLLIVLWVRSYWWAEFIRVPITFRSDICIWSIRGDLECSRVPASDLPANTERAVHFGRFEAHKVTMRADTGRSVLGFRWKPKVGILSPIWVVPYWLPVLLSLSIAILAFSERWRRYSLRTLLIVTTLVAVVLGIGALSI